MTPSLTMKRFAVATLFVVLPICVRAHEIPIFPVDVEMKIESHEIHVTIESKAGIWLDEILSVPYTKPLPATHWDPVYEQKAREEVKKSLHIGMDGRELDFTKFECRFVQEPLNEQSAKVVFDVHYPIVAVGKEIAGISQFFVPHWIEQQKSKDPDRKADVFETRLRVIGSKTLQLSLPINKPAFRFSTNGLLFTEQQKRFEKIRAIGVRLMSSAFFWIALIAIVAHIVKRAKRRREE